MFRFFLISSQTQLDPTALIESAKRLGSVIPGLVLKSDMREPTPLISMGFSTYIDVPLQNPAAASSTPSSSSSSSSSSSLSAAAAAAASSSASPAPTTVLEFALHELRAKSEAKAKSEPRFVHSLCATQGAPGTGKSQLLDQIAARIYKDDPDCLVLPFSYNGITPFDKFDQDHIETSVATRILLAALFKFADAATLASLESPWVKWSALWPLGAGLTARSVVNELVRASGAKRVVLLVDELIKVRPANFDFTLREILNVTDGDAFHRRALLTSLDGILPEEVTTSGRRIKRVPLSPLADGDVLQHLLVPQWKRLPYRWLVHLAMGHPRSLYGLLLAQEQLFRRPNVNADLFSVLQICRKTVYNYANSWESVTLHCLAAALLGETVSRKAPVPDDPTITYGHFLKQGIYINTNVVQGNQFVPKVSMMQLFFELQERQVSGMPQVPMGPFLLSMLDHLAASQLPDSSGMKERGLEVWHGYWEVLARRLRHARGETQLLLRIHYKLDDNSPFSGNISLGTVLLLEAADRDVTDMKALRTAAASGSTRLWNELGGLPGSALSLSGGHNQSVILRLGGQVAGFDDVVFDTNAAGEPVLTLIQCRYSRADATTSVSFADMWADVESMREAWAPHVDKPDELLPAIEKLRPANDDASVIRQSWSDVVPTPFGPFRVIPARNVFAVFVTMRATAIRPHRHVVVLTEVELRKLYGESLWSMFRLPTKE